MPGLGFRADGSWRKTTLPLEKSGLMINDRFFPNRAGICDAIHALSDWHGLIVLDFERPFSELLADFAYRLAGKRVLLPPTYFNLPHEAVIIGPWKGKLPFPNWLTIQKKRYGKIVLDAYPLCLRCAPGGRSLPWYGALPSTGFPCPGLGCMHCRISDGSILYWDTRKTLEERLNSTGVPVILFSSDLEALP